ncbi:MAG: hypothetical protein J6P03_06395 [Opitutales bacterium]|nr:hypothetical protein [Opitutales bacterium]
METKKLVYKVNSTTEIVSHGADTNAKEIRETSIRGMVRRWFAALGKKELCDEILGAGDSAKHSASKVIFRVDNVSPKMDSFTLTIIERNLKKGALYSWEELKNVVETWLILGGLGGKQKSGCGSIYCEELLLDTREEWLANARERLKGSSLYVSEEKPAGGKYKTKCVKLKNETFKVYIAERARGKPQKPGSRNSFNFCKKQ